LTVDDDPAVERTAMWQMTCGRRHASPALRALTEYLRREPRRQVLIANAPPTRVDAADSLGWFEPRAER